MTDAAEDTIEDRTLIRGVDVAVAGGGLIGLSVGWRLAARGLSVAVLDAEKANRASDVASGMLAASAELEPASSDLFQLALDSQNRWPGFRRDLERASAIDIDYRDDGTLVVAIGREEVERLRFRFDLQRREGARTDWLDARAVRGLEPGLRPSVTAGIACPHDHQVEPRRVMSALRRALAGAGGRLIPACEVLSLDRAGGKVLGFQTARGRVRAAVSIVAAGAWSGMDGLLPSGINVPVRPLKGQSLRLAAPDPTFGLRHVLWTDQVHIAPKVDRIIVGATVEEAGFDGEPTAGGLYALLEATRRILPGFEDLRIAEMQVGFRPTSADDAPILGETGLPGLLIATGHHRNGYLLAPVTAAAIEALVLGDKPPAMAARFGLDRFADRKADRKKEEHDGDHRQRTETPV